MKRFLTYLFLISCAYTSAQDLHLSQFYTAPLSYNPATAGFFNGDYRFMTNYKRQWMSIGDGYKTTMASYDMKIYKPDDRQKTEYLNTFNYLAAGISFTGDKAGKSNMGLMQLDLNIAYNLVYSRHQNISIGIRTGYAQRSVSTANLKWDNQFDGNVYDPNAPTGQNTIGESKGYLDLGAGFEYKYFHYKNRVRLTVGGSAFHLTQPDISFIGNVAQPLQRKYIGYVTGHFPVPHSRDYIVPQLMYEMQGPYKEIVIGGHYRYTFGMDTDGVILNTYSLASSYIQLGALYRVGDAIIFIASVELQKALSFGISYDVNISKLKVASQVQGGFELSLSYRGAFKK